MAEISKMHESKSMDDRYKEYLLNIGQYYEESKGSHLDKLSNFPKYAPRAAVARFLAKYEIFKKVLNIHGSVVECGVYYGAGLFTFAQLSAILEPMNHTRKIIGFDTFEGFAGVHEKDTKGTSSHIHTGGYSSGAYEDILRAVDVYDMGRSLGHINKVELVKGDFMKTLPDYLKENPHLIVSLLYLDFDLYEPTKLALKHLLPRMPKGAVVVFDELNLKTFPGETEAVLEQLDINKFRIERFSFGSAISYAVIE